MQSAAGAYLVRAQPVSSDSPTPEGETLGPLRSGVTQLRAELGVCYGLPGGEEKEPSRGLGTSSTLFRGGRTLEVYTFLRLPGNHILF